MIGNLEGFTICYLFNQNNMADNNSGRGFANMDPDKRRDAARRGGENSGKARHQSDRNSDSQGGSDIDSEENQNQ